MTTRELTLRIKEKARLLGFDAVGIAPASAAPGTYLQEWLANDFHGEMAYLERNADKRMSPDEVLDDVQSIISVALNYFHPYQLPYEQLRRGVVSRYAAGDDYHEVMEKKLSQLLDAIRALAPQAEGRVYVDTGPVMDKHWAAQSGIGWLGKHTNVLSRRAGSWFFLGEILLDLELEYDVPGTDHCGSCTRCLEVCPTDAFVEPYVLDSPALYFLPYHRVERGHSRRVSGTHGESCVWLRPLPGCLPLESKGPPLFGGGIFPQKDQSRSGPGALE